MLDRINLSGSGDESGSRGSTAVRASIGLGSRAADIDRLVAAVSALRRGGPAWAYADADGDYLPVPDPRPLPQWV